MSLDSKLYKLNKNIEQTKKSEYDNPFEKITLQIDFAKSFMGSLPEKEKEWSPLIEKAIDTVNNAVESTVFSTEELQKKAEDILAPIGKFAKEYKIHCIGHAHIDMNWMWSWPETVNNAHDTFYTVTKLMNDFPEAKFSQSQVSLYKAMKDHFPIVNEKIKAKIKSGNWEVTASNWVEGEKNCAAGEALCRHMLYSRKFLKENYDLEPEDVKIDWSADIFGHALTIPSIMTKGGVTRYYQSRPYDGPNLFLWQSKDGSQLLTFRDPDGYSGAIDKKMYDVFCNFIKDNGKTGVKDFMWCYGWGDHGGGPTREQIKTLIEFKDLKIFPEINFSTTNEFFTAVENTVDFKNLPVIEDERNFVFEGCYTSEANIKYANRYSEMELPTAETMAIIADKAVGMDYPFEKIEDAWQRTLFSQFHDIFPGSGVRATYNYAQGSFQEIMTTTSAIKNHALRTIGEQIDTASLVAKACAGKIGDSLGAGTADHGKIQSRFMTSEGAHTNSLQYDAYGTTTMGLGHDGADPILVYNPKPWKRSEVVMTKIWNKKIDPNNLFVYDNDGNRIKAQVIDYCTFYWFHTYYAIMFEAKDIPPLGYKVFVVDTGDFIEPDPKAVTLTSDVGDKCVRGDGQPPMNGQYILENEFLKVSVDATSAALVSVIDKETGYEYVKKGEKLGIVEYQMESANGMAAWNLSPVKERTPLDNGNFVILQNGPNMITIRADFKVNDSSICLETTLKKGSRKVDFMLRTRWLEVGNYQKGVPSLKAYFPTSFENGELHYEIPFGIMERKQSLQEVPALNWMNLSGEKQSVTLVNRAKYGHRCNEDKLSLTLLRSSFSPDPYPEVGDHEIEYAMFFNNDKFDASQAMRQGDDYNNPLNVVGCTIQSGDLPLEKYFVAISNSTPNINISAIKKAECGEGIIVRLYEFEGKDTEAAVCLCGIAKDAKIAVETDTLERPLDKSTAKIEDGLLSVKIKKYSNTTIWIK